jgi:hypothetical protein
LGHSMACIRVGYDSACRIQNAPSRIRLDSGMARAVLCASRVAVRTREKGATPWNH